MYEPKCTFLVDIFGTIFSDRSIVISRKKLFAGVMINELNSACKQILQGRMRKDGNRQFFLLALTNRFVSVFARRTRKKFLEILCLCKLFGTMRENGFGRWLPNQILPTQKLGSVFVFNIVSPHRSRVIWSWKPSNGFNTKLVNLRVSRFHGK